MIVHPETADFAAPLHRFVRRRALEQLPEFIIRQPGIPDDVTHCNRVHRIVARNGNDPCSVGHDDVFALTCDPKATLF